PKRIVDFGFDYSENKKITFDWESFTAPSCSKCNQKYSDLEAEIKPLVMRILSRMPLQRFELIKLLNWLDKVRIGLWLSYYFIEKNKGAIIPHLCIENRINSKDRFLQIHFLESRNDQKGLNAFGVNSLV